MPQREPEQPNTYFVQDRSNIDERVRLAHQERMLTAKIGGVLLEQTDPSNLRTVIDVGCGAGGWLIDVAKTYPRIEKLIGVDISPWMVDFANERAMIAGVRDRVEYHVADVFTLRSCCPQGYFDLVNQRFGWSYLRTSDWPAVLASYRHIARRGGIIRCMEGNALDTSNSPALEQLSGMAVKVFYRAEHLFEEEKHSIINHLPDLMRENGIQGVQERDVFMQYDSTMPEMQHVMQDARLVFRNMVPFLKRYNVMPVDFEEIYEQAMSEIMDERCTISGTMRIAWGRN